MADLKPFISLEFNHQKKGFAQNQNILYCFTWELEGSCLLYVGRTGSSNGQGKSNAFKRLGRHLANHEGKSKTQSIFNKYPELQNIDFTIEIFDLVDLPEDKYEDEVIQSLTPHPITKKFKAPKNATVQNLIDAILRKHAKEKVILLNGKKKGSLRSLLESTKI